MRLPFTSTVREFQAAQPDEPEPDEAAQQEITECDGDLRRLAAKPWQAASRQP
jgi:hypothetical protein